KAAEAAEAGQHLGPSRACDSGAYALDEPVSRVDIDAGILVGQRLDAHEDDIIAIAARGRGGSGTPKGRTTDSPGIARAPQRHDHLSFFRFRSRDRRHSAP